MLPAKTIHSMFMIFLNVLNFLDKQEETHPFQVMATGGHEESNKHQKHVGPRSVMELKDAIVRFNLTAAITVIHSITIVNLNIQIILENSEDTSR